LFEWASEVTHDELELSITPNITVREILERCPDEFLDPLLRKIDNLYIHNLRRRGFKADTTKYIPLEILYEKNHPPRSDDFDDLHSKQLLQLSDGLSISTMQTCSKMKSVIEEEVEEEPTLLGPGAEFGEMVSQLVLEVAKNTAVGVAAGVASSFLIDKIKNSSGKIKELRISGRKVSPEKNDIAKAFLEEIEKLEKSSES
jgi:hypothetical protein